MLVMFKAIIKVLLAVAVGVGAFFGAGIATHEITENTTAAWVVGIVIGFFVFAGLTKLFFRITSARFLFPVSPELYGQAEEEIEKGAIDKGLWAKALVQAGGDEVKRKAEYLKLRAKQLKKTADNALDDIEKFKLKQQVDKAGVAIKGIVRYGLVLAVIAAAIALIFVVLPDKMVSVSVNHNPKECSADYPMRVTVSNQWFGTVAHIIFGISVHNYPSGEDISSLMSMPPGEYIWEGKVKPWSIETACYQFPDVDNEKTKNIFFKAVIKEIKML